MESVSARTIFVHFSSLQFDSTILSVFNPRRTIVTYPSLSADAAGARRRESRFPDLHLSVPNHASTPSRLPPGVQVDGGLRVTGNSRVEEVRGQVEGRSLHVRVHVHVVANHLGQRDLPDLLQLGLREPNHRILIFIPERKSRFKVLVLRQVRPKTYQNLSHFLSCLNCMAMMQANVGPTSPPCKGLSLIPPGNKSISSTVA